MDTIDSIDEPVLVPKTAQKRKPVRNNTKREEIKRLKHSGGGKMPSVACTHTKRSCFCHADTLTQGDVWRNFESFYSNPTKPAQDKAILQLITIKKVQRRGPKIDNADKQRDREVTNGYHLLTEEDHPTKIPVCKTTFCSVLGEFRNVSNRSRLIKCI